MRLPVRWRGQADHPRSRGVYHAPSCPLARPGGSSPLARGLLHAVGVGAPGAGIIPARAGFTAGERPVHAGHGDHPRSRGVYPPGTPRTTPRRGSSPLARGLLNIIRRQLGGDGIIPARAGFTGSRGPPVPDAEDHPRSRGVYSAPHAYEWARPGSSPLARGLQDHPDGLESLGGIIPARAGFTRGPRGRACLVRIIPARAGFTGLRDRLRRGAEDHPRSRGVYTNGRLSAQTPTGSSPLARGLRGRAGADRPGRRIIPARAGFTAIDVSDWSRVVDHPRSRGVYQVQEAHDRAVLGSSPLARGLPRLDSPSP